ncbi:aldo/keto reductase [Dactylosporangium sp. CA-092794]|uniref:aldo/keto reductase n=1 Tax=Dactylosporangium sp. CA-092794 TaxID=3239929 RepID=UPI003D8E0A95
MSQVDIFERRPLTGTGLRVTPVGVGSSSLASMPSHYGYEVTEEAATATVLRVFASGLNLLDTSAGYGNGESERRIGKAIAAAGGLPAGFVLASKADPDPVTKDFSGEQVRRSLHGSLERLGVDRLPLYMLHDPERISFADATRPGGPVDVMVALREEGLVDAIAVAGGPVDLMRQYVATDAFQVVLTHNRYNLLNRAAEPLLAEAAERGVGVINAAPFGGGLLAKGPDRHPRFAYREAAAPLLDAAAAMQRACAEAGVTLAAAAVRFSLRDPRVGVTLLGASSPGRVGDIVAQAAAPVPEDLWPALERLVPAAEHWLS